MDEDWFAEPGATGTLTVEWHGDGWYLEDTEVNGEIKCKFPDEISPAASERPQQIDVTVSKFMLAAGNGPSYLFLDRADGKPVTADSTSDPDRSAQTSERTDSAVTSSSTAKGSTEGSAPDSPSDASSSKGSATNNGREIGTSRSSDRKGLDEIAREKIGDEEFTMSEEDPDSIIGQAKKRARSQGRDPAIDPTFQQSDDGNEEKDKDD